MSTDAPGEITPDKGSIGRKRTGAFQDFMARHLILSTQTPLSIKVRLVCEAGQAISWGSTKGDAKIAESYRVLGAQCVAVELAYKWQHEGQVVCSIRWLPGIVKDDEAYKEWFQAWDGKEAFESWLSLELTEKKVNGKQQALDQLSHRDRFLSRTKYLTEAGLGTVKEYFYQYAQERTMKFYGEIAKRIDPTVFERALRSSRGEL